MILPRMQAKRWGITTNRLCEFQSLPGAQQTRESLLNLQRSSPQNIALSSAIHRAPNLTEHTAKGHVKITTTLDMQRTAQHNLNACGVYSNHIPRFLMLMMIKVTQHWLADSLAGGTSRSRSDRWRWAKSQSETRCNCMATLSTIMAWTTGQNTFIF